MASGTCVTVWTKEGRLVTEHGRNMFKFAKCLAVRSTGGLKKQLLTVADIIYVFANVLASALYFWYIGH